MEKKSVSGVEKVTQLPFQGFIRILPHPLKFAASGCSRFRARFWVPMQESFSRSTAGFFLGSPFWVFPFGKLAQNLCASGIPLFPGYRLHTSLGILP